MVSVELAKRLRAAGLTWRPKQFDHFHIPDRDLDDRTFVIADLTVDVQPLADGIAAITFNGAVEWSLDYILQQDVVWVPSESQVRDRLGDRFHSLEHSNGGYTCVTVTGTQHRADTAADAYGLALLEYLETR